MRAATLCSVSIAASLAVVVIVLKYQVADLEDELVRVNRDIVGEQRAIHVLNAEWSYLNNPSRLASLAKDVLGMQPVEPGEIRTFADLPLSSVPSASGAVPQAVIHSNASQPGVARPLVSVRRSAGD